MFLWIFWSIHVCFIVYLRWIWGEVGFKTKEELIKEELETLKKEDAAKEEE